MEPRRRRRQQQISFSLSLRVSAFVRRESRVTFRPTNRFVVVGSHRQSKQKLWFGNRCSVWLIDFCSLTRIPFPFHNRTGSRVLRSFVLCLVNGWTRMSCNAPFACCSWGDYLGISPINNTDCSFIKVPHFTGYSWSAPCRIDQSKVMEREW